MRWTALLLALLCAAAFGSAAKPRPSKAAPKTVTLPVTTTSPVARKQFEHAMVNLEALRRAKHSTTCARQ